MLFLFKVLHFPSFTIKNIQDLNSNQNTPIRYPLRQTQSQKEQQSFNKSRNTMLAFAFKRENERGKKKSQKQCVYKSAISCIGCNDIELTKWSLECGSKNFSSEIYRIFWARSQSGWILGSPKFRFSGHFHRVKAFKNSIIIFLQDGVIRDQSDFQTSNEIRPKFPRWLFFPPLTEIIVEMFFDDIDLELFDESIGKL